MTRQNCVERPRPPVEHADMQGALAKFRRTPQILSLILALGFACWSNAADRGPKTAVVWVGPAETVTSGGSIILWLHQLNSSDREVMPVFPDTFTGRLEAGSQAWPVTLTQTEPAAVGEVRLAPGGFARRAYTLRLPGELAGTALLTVPQSRAGRVVLEIAPAAPDLEEPPQSAGAALLQAAEPRAAESGAMRFFKEHFFGYEPFYFIAGTESPNAKFQISLRYQLLSNEGPLAQRVPPLKGLNLAYTQTSLWDWNAPSAPFLDSSYKPELLYLWPQVDRGRWADWVRLDLQGGLQHESNGKEGADSRSLNLAYLRPTLRLGAGDGLQLWLAPRFWFYAGDLSDNPDLPDYRGYVDLRLVAGWARGLQFAATGRLGDEAGRGSLQLDLTYPMMRLLSGSFSLYLQAQYFTGYGESLLLYDQRSDAFRAGFALFR
jgi:outer membrane phospholipase A